MPYRDAKYYHQRRKIQSILEPKNPGWRGESRRHALAARGIQSSGVPPIHYGTADYDYSLYEMARQQVANEGIIKGDSDYDVAIASRMAALEDQYEQSRAAYIRQAEVLAETLASGLPWDRVATEAAQLHQTAFYHGEKYGDPIARDVSGMAENVIRLSRGDRPAIAGTTSHERLGGEEREELARQFGETMRRYVT